MSTTASRRPTEPAPRGARSALRRRRTTGLLVLLVLLVAAVLASIFVGARPLSPGEVLTSLTRPTGSDVDVIVRTLRIPRTVLGIVAGIALGVAGALTQAHTRNPLADPGLLGVSAGASLAVVLAIYALGVTDPLSTLWFAFAGALVASTVVFGVAAVGSGGASPLTLALVGAAVSAFLLAMIRAVVLLDTTTLDAFRFWEVGSLAGRGTEVLLAVLPFLALGLLLALASAPALNVLALGEDTARALGTRVGLTRVGGIVAITLLCGGATAACGPIAFLGLVVPHVARAVTGPDQRWLLPVAGLSGAVLLLAADVVGRVVVRPGELQVGIVLALLGAPFFVALVRRRKLAAL